MRLKIKVKVLYDYKYKNDDAYEKAIERWDAKGWVVADVAQDFVNCGDQAATIIYKFEIQQK